MAYFPLTTADKARALSFMVARSKEDFGVHPRLMQAWLKDPDFVNEIYSRYECGEIITPILVYTTAESLFSYKIRNKKQYKGLEFTAMHRAINQLRRNLGLDFDTNVALVGYMPRRRRNDEVMASAAADANAPQDYTSSSTTELPN